MIKVKSKIISLILSVSIFICAMTICGNLFLINAYADSDLIEAENCTLINASVENSIAGYSADGYAGSIDSQGKGIEYKAEIKTKGNYELNIRYNLPSDNAQTLSLFINGHFAKKVEFSSTKNQWKNKIEQFYLDYGSNSIEFRFLQGDGDINLDSFTLTQSKNDSVMILAPHEDDEIFAFSGTIESMVKSGKPVKIVFLTNGDLNGAAAGMQRISESIKALSHLGVSKYDITFLGYPDSSISKIYWSRNANAVYPSLSGNSKTYGNPELNMYDYHTLDTGKPADYSKNNIISDVYKLIDIYRPSVLYTTSLYDSHPDHSCLYRITDNVIKTLRAKKGYKPVLNESIVHGEKLIVWPQRLLYQKSGPIGVEFSNPFPGMRVPLYWKNAKKVPLTPSMMSDKYAAIQEFYSQNKTWSTFDYAFYKTNEFYWSRDYSNIAPYATVTASSETRKTLQTADKAVDGYAAGFNMGRKTYMYEWASNNEGSGAWIQLNFKNPVKTKKIVLNDRISEKVNIKRARLTFSDGSSITLDSIPSDGTDKIVEFNEKSITWVRLTVLQADGKNVGLTEFQLIES